MKKYILAICFLAGIANAQTARLVWEKDGALLVGTNSTVLNFDLSTATNPPAYLSQTNESRLLTFTNPTNTIRSLSPATTSDVVNLQYFNDHAGSSSGITNTIGANAYTNTGFTLQAGSNMTFRNTGGTNYIDGAAAGTGGGGITGATNNTFSANVTINSNLTVSGTISGNGAGLTNTSGSYWTRTTNMVSRFTENSGCDWIDTNFVFDATVRTSSVPFPVFVPTNLAALEVDVAVQSTTAGRLFVLYCQAPGSTIRLTCRTPVSGYQFNYHGNITLPQGVTNLYYYGNLTGTSTVDLQCYIRITGGIYR